MDLPTNIAKPLSEGSLSCCLLASTITVYHIDNVICPFYMIFLLEVIMFYDQFILLCEKTGEKPYSVTKALGIKSTSIVEQWKKGSTPRQHVLESVADHFGVTIDYLLTGEEKPAGFFKNLQIFGEQKQPAPKGEHESAGNDILDLSKIDEDRRKIILGVLQMTEQQKSAALPMIEYLISHE